LDPKPSYQHCTDPDDQIQLTDGKLTEGYFWVQKGTVGWHGIGTARIVIDLGKVEPIAGLSFRTAAGTAGVSWPQQIAVFMSEDGKTYRLVGDLIELSAEHGLPEAVGYRVHTYWTDRLKTKGRYVQLVVVLGGGYGFCDEIEVWRGEETWRAQPIGGKPVGDVADYLRTSAVTHCVRRRLRMDAALVRRAIEASKMPADKRDASLKKLDELTRRINAVTVDDPSKLSAVVPINDLHREILACHVEVLQSRGLKGLVAWQNNRWDPLGIIEAPETPPAAPPELNVRMMRGEYRSAAFNLTLAGVAEYAAHLKIVGLPPSPTAEASGCPDYIAVHEVQHVDTKEGIVVADALMPLSGRGDLTDLVRIGAGTTRQVWLTFHPKSLPPGQYQGQVQVFYPVVSSLGPPVLPRTPHVSVPLRLHVEAIEFPKQPMLSLGMWDYTDEPYAYGITKANQPLAIADMRAHFVDSPWAHASVISHPEKKDLDADGNLKPGSVDFSRFDRWLNDWKGARRYFVFLSVGNSLAGFEMGSPQFNKLVGQWFTMWADHGKKRGLKPKQVGVLLVDEPYEDAQDRVILAWAKAIKSATDFFCIWEDPTHRKLGTPDQVAMLEACDAICPNVGIFHALGEKAKAFYGKLCAEGRREFWFYWCSGPARLLDPYGYHRLQAWHAWVHGAVGIGFWAYGDNAGGNSWCEYLSPRTSFCPAYIAPDRITTSKHWEAVREGIEDYEYLHMLKRRIEQLTQTGKTSPALTKAKQLLEEGPKRVAHYGTTTWFAQRNRSPADEVRLEILDALVALSQL